MVIENRLGVDGSGGPLDNINRVTVPLAWDMRPKVSSRWTSVETV